MSVNIYAKKFLDFLNLDVEPASLGYLNNLVRNHQVKVKWETLSKILDWEKAKETGQYLPTIEEYVERITDNGLGGTCWTHSIGLNWLLSQLGFKVNYVYMDPGHLCLRVDLDKAYYVDVGYCAPLFQAYLMFDSFQVISEREIFDYKVTASEKITIERIPGPTKTLNPQPVRLEDLESLIKSSFNWNTSFVFRDIQVFGYVGGVATSLTNNLLKQHKETGKWEKELNKEEREEWIVNRFGIDKAIYYKASQIYESNRKNI